MKRDVMAKAKRFLAVISLTIFIIALVGCGGGGGAASGQFDDQTLNDNSSTIQADVNEATLIFVGTITAMGASPNAWSGPSMMGQPVTYTVDQVLKGTYSDAGIIIYQILLQNSRQAATDGGLSQTLFQVGSKLIILALQNTTLMNVGSDPSVGEFTMEDVPSGS